MSDIFYFIARQHGKRLQMERCLQQLQPGESMLIIGPKDVKKEELKGSHKPMIWVDCDTENL